MTGQTNEEETWDKLRAINLPRKPINQFAGNSQGEWGLPTGGGGGKSSSSALFWVGSGETLRCLLRTGLFAQVYGIICGCEIEVKV